MSNKNDTNKPKVEKENKPDEQVKPVLIPVAKLSKTVREALFDIANIRSVMTDGKRKIRVLLKTLTIDLKPDVIEAVKAGNFELVEAETDTSTKD